MIFRTGLRVILKANPDCDDANVNRNESTMDSVLSSGLTSFTQYPFMPQINVMYIIY